MGLRKVFYANKYKWTTQTNKHTLWRCEDSCYSSHWCKTPVGALWLPSLKRIKHALLKEAWIVKTITVLLECQLCLPKPHRRRLVSQKQLGLWMESYKPALYVCYPAACFTDCNMLQTNQRRKEYSAYLSQFSLMYIFTYLHISFDLGQLKRDILASSLCSWLSRDCLVL